MEFQIRNQKILIKEEIINEPPEVIRRQLEEYMERQRTDFDLCIDFPENFTGEVMKETHRIPYGETKTYEDIAQKLETAPIAVGQACGRNPLPVIVPCHRVAGKNSLGGYKYGESVKEKLLDFESENLDNQ